MDHERLFREIHPHLFRYLHRLTGDPDLADDVAQESFVRLTREKLAEAEARPWLFTVATNLVRDRARKAVRHRRLEVHVPRPSPAPSPAAAAERKDEVARVRAALGELADRDRTMLLMREEGFRYEEIARVVGVAPASVGTLLARAGRRFAAAYAADKGALNTIHDVTSR